VNAFGLPQDACDLQQKVRSFIDKEVIPLEHQIAGTDLARFELMCQALRAKAMNALGEIGPALWERWREAGVSWRVRQLILEEAGRSPLGSLALQCAAPDLPNMDLLAAVANSSQAERYLEPLRKGQFRSCFAMTEPAPGAGSDPAMLKTTARQDGSNWVIDGRKWFISGASGAKFAIVIAVADGGPTMFIVETGNKGWHVTRELASLDNSQIGGHAEIVIENCVVADDSRLGAIGQALEYAQIRLEPARINHCMRMVGRAQRVAEFAEQYVAGRESFGSALSDLQGVQTLVADNRIDLMAARLMTWQVATMFDLGESVKQASAMAKVFVSEAIGRVADRAVQLAGAAGTLTDQPIGQFYQEVRPFRIYDGASEVHRSAIGRRILKSARNRAATHPEHGDAANVAVARQS
jgi:acyl-CoA dehydrogenase